VNRFLPTHPLFTVLLLLLALSGVYLTYTQGLNIAPQFDDPPNLSGLAEVDDSASALRFIAQGRAGPSGRPLSLASFLIEGPGWPASAPQMRRVNILIHLLNGLLVFYLAYLLGREAFSLPENSAAFSGALIAVLWANSPLLSSTSLMLVQRMTSLSALFVLLGLITYLKGRTSMTTHPRRGMWRMSVGIVLGTLLATLSKENGALLPLYALCLEIILPSATRDAAWTRRFQHWRRLFLWLPSLAVIGYLLYQLPGIERAYEFRDFTLGERLLSEARILWNYLLQALNPDLHYLGPFNDDYPVSHGLLSPPVTLFAFVAWFAVGLLAILGRRRYPLLTFSVAWYLGGHLIESTLVPLELYFPHRNYLPLISPLILLVHAGWQAPRSYRGLILAGLTGMALLQGVRNWQNISLWSQPLLSAKIWYQQHPSSMRAVQYLATKYFDAGWPDEAMQLMEKARDKNPSSTSLALQTFNLACSVERDPERLQGRLADLPSRVTESHHEFVISDAVHKLVNMLESKECQGVLTTDNVLPVVDALLRNPEITRVGSTRANLLGERARLFALDKKLDPTVRSLQAAFEADPLPVRATALAAVLYSAGLFEEAGAELKNALESAPLNPLKYWYWRRTIVDLQAQMRRARGLPPQPPTLP